MNEILVKRIKGCLKTKISITAGLIVAYLITGNFGYAQEEDIKLKSEVTVNEISTTIQFNGDKGMSAEESGKTALNKGIIKNNGNYGMYASSGGSIVNDTTGVVKNTLEQGMRGNGANTVVINRGIVANEGNYGMISGGGAVATNEITGKIENKGIQGMRADSASTLINRGIIANGNNDGMWGKNGAILVNEETGKIENNGNNGIILETINSIAINKGEISNKGILGLVAIDEATAINEKTGKIENNGDYGLYLDNATGVNKGEISNKGIYGIFGTKDSILINEGTIVNTSYNGMVIENGGTATNKGIIKNNGFTGLAVVNGGIAVNEIAGKIENNGNNGIYINGANSTGINEGTISNKGNYGMYALSGGLVVNNETGVIKNTLEQGMRAYGMNTSAVNKGIIANDSNSGMWGNSGTILINEETGTISNKGSNGIVLEGISSVAVNKGQILNKGTHGMNLKNGAIGINEGTIANTSYNGMVVESGGTATNKGIIKNNGYSGLVAIDRGVAVNEKTGTISNNGSYGLYVDGAAGINRGIISNEGTDGMSGTNNSTLINEGTIVNTSNNGMLIGSGGTATNKGIISNDGYSGLVVINGGTVINGVTGTISNTGKYGMFISGLNSVGINNGTISNNSNDGMYISNKGIGINNGVIKNKTYTGMLVTGSETFGKNQGVISNGGDYGMIADGAGSTAINYKNISNNGKHKMGSFNGGTIINESAYGLVVNGDNEIGMIADGSGSTAINKGIIEINGSNSVGMVATNNGIAINKGYLFLSGKNSEGMRAENGGQVRNEGKIEINDFHGVAMAVTSNSTLVNDGEIELNSIDGVGIKVSGQNAVVRNNGEINISGIEVSSKNSSLLTQDSRGNQAMVIEEGAMFINNGLFIVDGDLNSSEMGGGNFVIEGGTVEADSIRGDYYASGALAWGSGEVTREDGTASESTEYDTEYSTYQMFKTDDMYVNMYSNSAMFDVALTEQDSNGYYGIDMYRKNFNDIIENQEYAKYLENNYTTVGETDQRADLYKAYKLITNENDLNKYVGRTFGETIYPAMMEQNYEIAKMNNKKLKSEVFNKNINQEVGEYNYIGYATYSDSEDRKSDNFSENDMKYSSVSLGVDKKITETTRVGVLGTIGKTDISFDDGADREDDVYQLNAFSIYEKDGLKGIVNAYAGKIKGDLDRTLAFTSLHEKMDGDTESNFYGLNLSLEKEYQVKGINLSPRIELNSMYMEEDKVKESGEYALDVNSTNGKSVEAGIGLVANKTITLNEKYRLIPELSAMYYRELGNPYKDRSVKLSSVSNDSVSIKGYEEGKDTGEFDLNINLEREGANLRLGVAYEVNDQGGITTPYMSLGYTF